MQLLHLFRAPVEDPVLERRRLRFLSAAKLWLTAWAALWIVFAALWAVMPDE
jgi:hypothetical protein